MRFAGLFATMMVCVILPRKLGLNALKNALLSAEIISLKEPKFAMENELALLAHIMGISLAMPNALNGVLAVQQKTAAREFIL